MARQVDAGCTAGTEQNFNDPEAARRAIVGGWFPEEFVEADDMLAADKSLAPDDPSRMVTLQARILPAVCNGKVANHADGRAKEMRFR